MEVEEWKEGWACSGSVGGGEGVGVGGGVVGRALLKCYSTKATHVFNEVPSPHITLIYSSDEK